MLSSPATARSRRRVGGLLLTAIRFLHRSASSLRPGAQTAKVPLDSPSFDPEPVNENETVERGVY
jgi:hypothetical protein